MNGMLNLSDDLKKIRTKFLIFSGVSLFIALTKVLPQKVAILGLDLSKNETMTGWFILVITSYLLLSFLIYSLIDIVQYYLPTLIMRKTKSTTGDILGFTIGDVIEEGGYVDPKSVLGCELGTINGEKKDIDNQNS